VEIRAWAHPCDAAGLGFGTTPEGEMPILEHLAELRDRLVRCGVPLAVTTTVACAWLYERLLHFVTRSYCDIPASYRITSAQGGCRLAALGPLDRIGIRLRVA